MKKSILDVNQILTVSNFQELVTTPFAGNSNAICLKRQLTGDFHEITEKAKSPSNITVLEPDDLLELQLSEQGQLAREVLLNDFQLLQKEGASPVLNVIKYYERDQGNSFFPTDVYSFHVDRSPVPTSTFLCTYYGAPSEILPNAQAIQKVLIPEVRTLLRKEYNGRDEDFEVFLKEHFYDLHYAPKAGAQPVNLGPGNLWRLAVDHPESKVLPCIHRAPIERSGESRLLLIC